MKAAIYIDAGRAQLALTAETEFEKNALKVFHEATNKGLTAHKGGFYSCAGGWTRHTRGEPEDSLIFIANKDDA